MPNILHPSTVLENSPLKIKVPTECSFANPESNPMVQTVASVDDIRACIDDYESFITSKLSEQDADKMIRYSNFRIEDIQAIIAQNQDCRFLRAYNCIDESGTHFHMIAPVTASADGSTKKDNDTNYVIDCCRCKPDCGSGGRF